MKNLSDPKVIDHNPSAKMRSAPMSKTRRVVCFVVGLGLLLFAFVALVASAPAPGTFNGLAFGASLLSGFGAAVLLVSAIFPNFTLAREDLDRRRHR